MSAVEHNSSLSLNGSLWFVHDCTLVLDVNPRRVALFLLYLFIFLAGLLENVLVLWVNWRRRHTSNGVLFCIINVTVSDLMVIVILPFFMMEVSLDRVWLWGRVLCKVTNVIYVVNFYSSSLFLGCMTLERYLSLTRPSISLFPALGWRRWVVCGSLWFFSLVLALMENVHVDLLEWDDGPGCYMMPENNFVEWYVSVSFLSLIFQFLGPGAIIVFCNVLIAQAARSAPRAQRGRDVWLVHVYSLVFVLCWLPYHMVMFLMVIDDLVPHLMSCNAVEALYFSFNVVQSFSLLHCVANPLLYNFLSKNFRNNLINALLGAVHREGAGPGTGAMVNGDEHGKQRKDRIISI